MLGPGTNRLACLALAASVLALVGPAGAVAQQDGQQAQQQKEPNLEPLLDRFPIGTGRVQTADPAAQGAEAEADESGASRLFWVLLALWAGAIAFLLAFGVRTLVRWQRGKEAAISSLVPAPAPPQKPSNQTTERSPPVSETSKDRDVSKDGASPVDGSGGHEGAYDDVGKGVAGILEAAEVAADKIRADAAEAAAGIRRAAEDEAKVRLATAEQDAAKLRSDAEASVKELQSAAEVELESRRKEAEAQAQSVLADAQLQALALQESAEEGVRHIHDAARAREEALRARIQPVEDNVRRALDELRGIGGELGELVADLGQDDASLVEDLNESARTAELRLGGSAGD